MFHARMVSPIGVPASPANGPRRLRLGVAAQLLANACDSSASVYDGTEMTTPMLYRALLKPCVSHKRLIALNAAACHRAHVWSCAASSKRYPTIIANDHVDLIRASRARFNAVLGENGAGKKAR